MSTKLPEALEFFSGIGGASLAWEGRFETRLALDQSAPALEVYTERFPKTPRLQTNLESWLTSRESQAVLDAPFWWLSPPCQPYTVQGLRLDLRDHRAAPLLALLRALETLASARRPRALALENVVGFRFSKARTRVIQSLKSLGYETFEASLCPTQLQIPMRRPRYYLLAWDPERSRTRPPDPLTRQDSRHPLLRPILPYLEPGAGSTLPELELSREESELRSLHRLPHQALIHGRVAAHTFTSGYGRKISRTGSVLEDPERPGRFRRFSPVEVARLMGQPPIQAPLRLEKRWALLGNSLASPVVSHWISNVTI